MASGHAIDSVKMGLCSILKVINSVSMYLHNPSGNELPTGLSRYYRSLKSLPKANLPKSSRLIEPAFTQSIACRRDTSESLS